MAQLCDLARGLGGGGGGGGGASKDAGGTGRGKGKGRAKEKASVDVNEAAGGKVELSREVWLSRSLLICNIRVRS